MKRMKKNSVLTILLSAFCLGVLPKANAQISFGGTPVSWKNEVRALSDEQVPVVRIVPTEKPEQLLRENENARRIDAPMALATLVRTDIDLARKGLWQQVGADSICRLSLRAEGAEGLLLYYSRFLIPKEGKLFIYNTKTRQLLGAYTHRTNARGGRFSTEMIYGEELTLEYVKPANSSNPDVCISQVGYSVQPNEAFSAGVDAVLRTLPKPGVSAACMVDVNCSEGDNWQQQKKGVAVMSMPIGSRVYICSGTLLNNVYQDHTPYFLTAHHCLYQNGDTIDLKTTQFYFHYEAATCGDRTTIPTGIKTMVGANLLVDIPLDGGSDGVLLQLQDSIPASYDVYYNGWDATHIAPASGVAIHHPSGDLKKISTFTEQAEPYTYSGMTADGATDAHWLLGYTATANGYGVTAVGSSGCPLFNADGRVVATLTGGNTYCSLPNAKDYYGGFYYHWDKYPSQQMKKYLNAANYNVLAINGIGSLQTGKHLTGELVIEITPQIVGNMLTVNTTAVLRSIKVYDLAGRLVAATKRSPIYINGWQQGVYVIVAETSEGDARSKVIVTR